MLRIWFGVNWNVDFVCTNELILFLLLFFHLQTQSCGYVYILQTPLICRSLAIEIANNTVTKDVATGVVKANQTSSKKYNGSFWGKSIWFRIYFQFRYYRLSELVSTILPFFISLTAFHLSFNHCFVKKTKYVVISIEIH